MRFLWLSAVLLTSSLTLATMLIQPEDDAQMSTALDVEQYILDVAGVTVEDHRETLDDALDVGDNMGSMKILKKQSTLAKLGSMVGSSLKAVHAAGALAGFVFTFIMMQNDDVSELINRRFNEVNAKLDSLDEKLEEMHKSIKVNIAFNVFLAQWIEWENRIESGAVKLKEVRSALGRTKDSVQKLKLVEEYVVYYEHSSLEHTLMDLYKMAAHEESVTHRNIFDLFIAEYGCDITILSRLMIAIKSVMTSGSQQKLTYYTFKGNENRAKKGFKQIQKQFFEIRNAFDKRVWRCRNNALEQAEEDAKKLVKSMKNAPRENVVRAVFKKLKVTYPQYSWAVVGAKEGEFPEKDFKVRGDSYFTIQDDSNPSSVKTYYVVYGDSKWSPKCRNSERANTFIVFKQCDGCDLIMAQDRILTTESCGKLPLIKELKLDQSQVVKLGKCKECPMGKLMRHLHKELRCDSEKRLCGACRLCSGIVMDRYVKGWDYIASVVKTRNVACQSERCNGNGQCKPILRTTTHQCICKPYFEGEACDRRIDFDDTIDKMVSELRHNFNIVNGVPTTVDVYFSIRDLKHNLDVVLDKIKASFAYTNQIIQHSDVIQIAEDIADTYSKLQKNEIRFNRFGEILDKFLNTVTNAYQLSSRFQKMILGVGTLVTPGHDIYNSYKREYCGTNGGGCGPRYNQDMKRFRDSLAYLDEAVGEALLLYHKWLIETKATTKAMYSKYLKDAEYIRDTFRGRQAEFDAYWREYSCGPLEVNGTTTDCKAELTFEGMTIPLQCDQKRVAEPKEAKCVRERGSLQWDSQPVCKFVWSEFNDWTECSKECGGGLTFQNRTCVGTADVTNCERDQGGLRYRSKVCNAKSCCSEEFGKFQCASGKCISRRQLCDGRDDCGDEEDEGVTQCKDDIRSGEEVVFKSLQEGHKWLSCFCWSDKTSCLAIYGYCMVSGCQGTIMNQKEWKICWGERFYLYGKERKDGQTIRSGDLVGLKYNDRKGQNWLSCSGRYCSISHCPKKSFSARDHCPSETFQIFSPDRLGSCSGDVKSKCTGQPIKQGDTIMLFYKREKNWVCRWGGDLMKDKCSGQKVVKSKACKWEQWKIIANKPTDEDK